MRDVTLQEVEAAAAESTLAAVQCSGRHWLYNANVEGWSDINSIRETRCALCKRCTGHTLPEGGLCPLRDEDSGGSCSREWLKASYAVGKDMEKFKQAANALVVRFAKIEYDLMHEEEKKEEKKTPEEPKLKHGDFGFDAEGEALLIIHQQNREWPEVSFDERAAPCGMLLNGKHQTRNVTKLGNIFDLMRGLDLEFLPKTTKLVIVDESKKSDEK